MATAYILIESITVGAGGTNSFTFTSIPQTYTDLILKISARSNVTGAQRHSGDTSTTLNGDTGSNYYNKLLQGNPAIAPYGESYNAGPTTSFVWSALLANADNAANIFGNSEMYFPNYTGNNFKSMNSNSCNENNTSNSSIHISAGYWANTVAITSITCSVSTMLQHTTAYLYGISNA